LIVSGYQSVRTKEPLSRENTVPISYAHNLIGGNEALSAHAKLAEGREPPR